MASITATAHIRIARPTASIAALRPFYIDGLGFRQLGAFHDHEGIDGVMLGHPGAAYHLEFTCAAAPGSNAAAPAAEALRAPTKDNLLVFYLPDEEGYRAAVERMEACGLEAVRSENPYWDRCGRTFEDVDGYRVVLANMANPVANR